MPIKNQLKNRKEISDQSSNMTHLNAPGRFESRSFFFEVKPDTCVVGDIEIVRLRDETDNMSTKEAKIKTRCA